MSQLPDSKQSSSDNISSLNTVLNSTIFEFSQFSQSQSFAFTMIRYVVPFSKFSKVNVLLFVIVPVEVNNSKWDNISSHVFL